MSNEQKTVSPFSPESQESPSEAVNKPAPTPRIGATFTANVSGFRLGAFGGYKLTLDIPEIEIVEAQELLRYAGKNVEVSVVLLPD